MQLIGSVSSDSSNEEEAVVICGDENTDLQELVSERLRAGAHWGRAGRDDDTHSDDHSTDSDDEEDVEDDDNEDSDEDEDEDDA